MFLFSDPILPEHSKHVLNPLYHIREHNFHDYLGYFETINLLEQTNFKIVLSRPYRYEYSSFDKYLEGVDNGFINSPPEGFSELLKLKLNNAWSKLDQRVKMEMNIKVKNLKKGFMYHMIDLAITRQ